MAERAAQETVSTSTHEWDRWLAELEQLWEGQEMDKLRQTLAKAFCSVERHQLHDFVLHLLDKSQDLRKMKPSSLGLIILKEFSEWMPRHCRMNPKELHDIITDGMKLQALRLATSGHMNLFDMISRLYQLRSGGNEYLASHLRVLLARKQYKEAAVAAYKLGLQYCFKIDEICLPLIFQDKVNLVEKYIQDSKDVQVELIKRLDFFCAKDSGLVDFIDTLNVPGARKEKLRPKNLSKLVLRLAKLFQLDPSIFPNTTFYRDLGAVRFLLYKKYIEQTMDTQNWDELIINTIRGNQQLQEEFIVQLLEYGDATAAAKWALHFGIDRRKLTSEVLLEIDKYQASPSPSDVVENWEDDLMPFYQLNLPFDHILMVSSQESLELCSTRIIQDGQIVGIDMEWTPSFTATQITRVALVQLATADWVYLLDMPVLMNDVTNKTRAFFQNFLSSTKVLKLGFGISGDFRMLTKSYPSLRQPVLEVKRMVDLHGLSQQILAAQPDILKVKDATAADNSRRSSVKGLSELTLMCFGLALDKKEQLSDWEKRPLRPSQAQYAALDAFCLLEIYSYLKAKVDEVWLDIDMEPVYSSPKAAKKPKVKTKESKRPKNKAPPHSFKSALNDAGQPLRPADLSVVCDTMLQGLGRQLRSCGVDVKILETTDEHDEAAKIAFRDGRMILTAGTPYHTLKSQVGEGKCMVVDTSCSARHQVIQVLKHFNVQVHQKDIFSRCQACNGGVYLQVNNEDMKRLWLRKKVLLEAESTAAEMPATSESPAAGMATAGSPAAEISATSGNPAAQMAATSGSSAAQMAATSGSSAAEMPATSVSPAAEMAATSGSPAAEMAATSGSPATEIPTTRDSPTSSVCGRNFESILQRLSQPSAFRVASTTATLTSSSAKYHNRPLHDYDSDGDVDPFIDLDDFEDDEGDYYDIAKPACTRTPLNSHVFQVASSTDGEPQATQSPMSQPEPPLNSSEMEAKLELPNDSFSKRQNRIYNPPTDEDLSKTLDFDKVTVSGTVPLQVETVPEGILERIETFYCCARCGKTFWEGTHFDRVLTQFANVLIDFSNEPSV